MATRSKTHKAPAPKKVAAWPKPKEEPAKPKLEINEIERLAARYRFLLADQDYKSTLTSTVKESLELSWQHSDELNEIESKIAKLVPKNFYEMCELLDFAILIIKDDGTLGPDGHDILMLKNLRLALPDIVRNGMEDWGANESIS